MEVNEIGKSPADVLDARQWTPLHVAVKCSEETNVVLLLENGADPNAKAKKEKTPLHKARSAKMAEILLAYGADPYLIKVGKRELQSAYDVFLDKNASAAELLMNKGISSNDQGGNFMIPELNEALPLIPSRHSTVV